MDGAGLFHSVLEPGEHLLWTGQPRKYTLGMAGLNFIFLAVGLVWIFNKTLRLQTAPLPPALDIELVLVATLFVWVGYLLVSRLLRSWKTSYALTDRRLLMAVGPSRHRIREFPLTELDAVVTEYRPKVGKVLVLSWRATGHSNPERLVWAVRDVEGVRKLIEAARTAVSSKAAEPSISAGSSW
jgi:hypothetical protein